MQHSTTKWQRRLGVVATGAAMLALAACGGEDSEASGSSGLPDDIVDRGYISVAGDASYPPIGFMDDDGTTIVGLDSDLAKALGKELGVELRMQNSSFDAIIPGLQGGEFDMGMSWMNDTEERRAVVDFVDYSEDGSSFLVPADGSARPEELGDLCGLSVAVQKGTVQQTDATAQSDECDSNGEEPIDLQVYPDQSAANLALTSGRADAGIADTPVAVWQAMESDGRIETSGKPYGHVHHGIALPKDSDLTEPIAQAMQELMDNGTYAKILKRWDMSDAAIDEVLINGEPLS